MEKYETVMILSPDLAEQQINDLITALEQSVNETKGNLIQTDQWGKRKLAYPVKKCEEGFYVLFFYEASGDTVKELERRMRMNENVIKFLTVQSLTDKPSRPTDMEFHSMQNVAKPEKKNNRENP